MMIRGRVLVIDRGAVHDALHQVIPDVEYVERARLTGGPDAVARAREGCFDVFVADLSQQGIWERRTVARLQEVCPDVPLLLATDGESEGEYPERAYACLPVPVDPAALRHAILNAVDKHRLIQEKRILEARLHGRAAGTKTSVPNKASGSASASSLVGESEAMHRIRALIAEVGPSDMTVLVTGESGTGKELVARAIHAESLRSATGALIKINCPAVPEQLLESELFGHEPGAFTGAVERKPGRLELAVGGTAFLDEIGDMPLSVQAKLLQVLEHKQFLRLGGTETLHVDVRFVAATNLPLLEQIQAGRFRKDLYFRLHQYVLRIPPLRERPDDIAVLVKHFLAKFAPMYGRLGLEVSNGTMARLIRHDWPGNVRELESVVQCFALTGREESILSALGGRERDEFASHDGTFRQCEKSLILATLLETRWNRRRAAQQLGMSYNTLRRRIAQYGLETVNQQASVPAMPRLRVGTGELS